MNAGLHSYIAGRSTRQRVLGAIRSLFRQDGLCPSHSQIAIAAGIATKRVQRYVEQLAAEGVLTYRPRVPRSIRLADRGAMLSDDELRLAIVGRNWTIVESSAPVIGAAFPVPGEVADWGLKLLDELKHID